MTQQATRIEVPINLDAPFASPAEAERIDAALPFAVPADWLADCGAASLGDVVIERIVWDDGGDHQLGRRVSYIYAARMMVSLAIPDGRPSLLDHERSWLSLRLSAALPHKILAAIRS